MKRCFFGLLGVLCLASVSIAQQYGNDDARFGWKCVYPYSETNCDRIISSWSSDHGLPRQSIVDGLECSNCEPFHITDMLGDEHLLYAKCLNMKGARLTSADVQAPITKFKEGASGVGWTVLNWEFTACFDTWQCYEYCALDANPPACVVYQLSSWGTHVPVQGQACSYGAAPPTTAQATTPTGSSSQLPSRGVHWYPTY